MSGVPQRRSRRNSNDGNSNSNNPSTPTSRSNESSFCNVSSSTVLMGNSSRDAASPSVPSVPPLPSVPSFNVNVNVNAQHHEHEHEHDHDHADSNANAALPYIAADSTNTNTNTNTSSNHDNNINRGHYFAQSSHTRRRRTHSKNLNHSHININTHGHRNVNDGQHQQPQSSTPTQVTTRTRHAHTHSNSQHRRHRNININNRINEPTFSTTVSDLMYIIQGYASRLLQYLRQCAPQSLRKLGLVLLLAIAVFATMMVVIVLRFIHFEATPLCTPPYDYDQQQYQQTTVAPGSMATPQTQTQTQTQTQRHPRPLVEYYVHGRGNGHYARSVSIVESLLSKGVDVRMFIGRATMWRAVNEAHAGDTHTNSAEGADQFHSVQEGQEEGGEQDQDPDDLDANANNNGNKNPKTITRGQVTVTSVASLLPSMSIMDSLSLLVERVMSDCEIAKNTKHYPVLVISDGDWPGMWRAKVGSIPMVSVSHGQTFVIGHQPEWVKSDPILTQAWKKQRKLNSRTSRDANWLIATNFVDIPVNGGNGVVARSPMRPEVIRMGKERQIRKQQLKYMNKEGGVLQGRGKMAVDGNFMEPWQSDELNALLFGKDVMSSLKIVRKAVETKQIGALSGTDLKLTRRKLVICYFRDKNGDLLTNALLRSGFDVLLFERGYHKGLSDEDGEKKFGQNLMVHREPNRHVSEDEEEVPLKEYWVDILSKHDRKFLEDDEFEESPATDNNVKSQDERSEEMNATRTITRTGNSESDAQSLQNAIETVNNLFKSDVDAPRIIRVTDMSLFVPLLSIADGVASSAGSQLLSECIYSHLNVLALHREDDSEQRLNIAFSKHRFDRLSKEVPSQGSLNGENIGYYATENVVHGMSQEKFARVFETISRHQEAKKDEFETILTEAEETMLLRTPESVQTYADFKAYVEAVRQSPISWSYYHDLFFGIMDQSERNAGKEDVEGDPEHDDSAKEYIDPFQGMPEAASIIVEIIDDLTKKSSVK